MAQWEALQASELAMRIVPLSTRMDDATATGGNASSDFVPGLRRVISLDRRVDIMVGPPGGDFGNGFIDGSPWFQTCLFRIGRVGLFWEGG